MNPSISAELQAHYASGACTLARVCRIERQDGQVFGFTDHDRPIEFEGLKHEPTSVFDASAISTRAALNVDNAELSGLLDHDGITDVDLEAGRWDGAWFELREVNWRDVSMGAKVLRVGRLGNAQRRAGRYVTELRGLMQVYANNVGRIVSPSCDAKLGDARCKVPLSDLAIDATVSSSSSRRLILTTDIADSDGDFTGGSIAVHTGLNVGFHGEIKSYSIDSDGAGTIELQLPMPFDFTIGDAFTMLPGCDHIHGVLEDGTVVGDCLNTYDNVINFQGFPFVPGQDRVLLVGGQ